MTVNNSGFSGPFIISSTFEIRVLKQEKLFVYRLHGQLVGSAFGPCKQNSGLVNFVPDLRLAQIGSIYKETASGA